MPQCASILRRKCSTTSTAGFCSTCCGSCCSKSCQLSAISSFVLLSPSGAARGWRKSPGTGHRILISIFRKVKGCLHVGRTCTYRFVMCTHHQGGSLLMVERMNHVVHHPVALRAVKNWIRRRRLVAQLLCKPLSHQLRDVRGLHAF